VSFRRITDPERLHALIEAMMLIESEMDLAVLLRSIIAVASELVHARYGALGIINDAGDGLSNFITFGLSDEESRRIGDLPRGLGLLGEVLVHATSRRSDDLANDPASVGFPLNHPVMHTFLGVPVRSGSGKVFGNLYVTDRRDGEPFSDEDEALLEAFGRAASLIVDEARLREQLRALTLSDERVRLARDLHDTVIQRLFAVGLSLQSTLASALEPATSERISAAVDDLDATIRQIRTTIFDITRDPSTPQIGVRARVITLINEVSTQLELPVDVSFEGPIDTLVGPVLANHLINVIRELLANAVRHAQAKRVDLRLEVSPDQLTLTVSDDGVGFSGDLRWGNGLRNITERAGAVGGSFHASSPQPTGATVVWTAKQLQA
jgi:signal transduction histidine kinase